MYILLKQLLHLLPKFCPKVLFSVLCLHWDFIFFLFIWTMLSLILVSKYSVFGLYNLSLWTVFSLHVLIFLVKFFGLYSRHWVLGYGSSEFCFILRRLLSHCCGNNRQAGWTQTTNWLLGGSLNLSSVLLSLAELLGCRPPHTWSWSQPEFWTGFIFSRCRCPNLCHLLLQVRDTTGFLWEFELASSCDLTSDVVLINQKSHPIFFLFF